MKNCLNTILFGVMVLGFAVNASTGLALFISEAAEKGTARVFWIKLTVIAVALLVARRMKRDLYGPAALPVNAAAGRLQGLAVLSLCLWLGAIFAGRLMAYVN